MEKSLFEQMGGTYTQVGDYLLPNLILPEQQDQLNILVREYRCSGGTDTANPAAGNRCSGTGIPHLIECHL